MCTAMFQNQAPKAISKPVTRSPVDVPLGEGLADVAKTSILTRRERIEKALADAQ